MYMILLIVFVMDVNFLIVSLTTHHTCAELVEMITGKVTQTSLMQAEELMSETGGNSR